MGFEAALRRHLTGILAAAVQTSHPGSSSAAASTLTTPPNAQMGEFAFACFQLGKELKQNPAQIAKTLQQNLPLDNDPYFERVQAQGPYLNFSVKRNVYFQQVLADIRTHAQQYGQDSVGAGKTVVIDFSSPNIAKHLAFHHLRSTVIGHSLVKIFRTLGYNSVGINHLGDWGTQFGKLITAYLKWGPKDDNLGDDPVGTLNDLYVRFQQESQNDPTLLDEARLWFSKLEQGDEQARYLWERFRTVSLAIFSKVYQRLNIQFTEITGESTYISMVNRILSEIDRKGLSQRSEGALIVDLSAYNMPPCLLKKGDEATLYATRDICAAVSRAEKYQFDRMIYVVDAGQSLHFKQFFKVLELMEFPWADRVEHVNFGIIKFGGQKTRTRQGNIILLEDVLDEARDLAREKITEKNPDLADKDAVAEQVGIGAIIFADLSGRRARDINFTWEEILNFDGRTGPYMQYSYTRAHSILKKAAPADLDLSTADLNLLTLDEEFQLARALGGFPDAIADAAKLCEPSLISDNLLLVCECFHRYHTSGKSDRSRRVLVEDLPTRKARLYLTQCTLQTLQNGMELLGMPCPDEM